MHATITFSGVAKGEGGIGTCPPVVVRVNFFKNSKFGSVTTGYDTLLKFWSADYSLRPSLCENMQFFLQYFASLHGLLHKYELHAVI